jgi:rRNA maturation endonuclease Nob1
MSIIYRCTGCQYTTTDPSQPECPHCFGNLIEQEDTTEDFLESEGMSQFFGGESGF